MSTSPPSGGARIRTYTHARTLVRVCVYVCMCVGASLLPYSPPSSPILPRPPLSSPILPGTLFFKSSNSAEVGVLPVFGHTHPYIIHALTTHTDTFMYKYSVVR